MTKALLFIRSEIDKWMNAVDLCDSGMKVFETFQELSFTTKSRINKKYCKNFIQKMLTNKDVVFIQFNEFYGIQPNVKILSVGTHFVWVEDLVQGLNEVLKDGI